MRAGLQKGYDDADRKLTYLKEKVAKAKGAAKKNADAALVEVEKRATAAKESIAKITGAAADNLATLKTGAESDVAAFIESVDALETTLK